MKLVVLYIVAALTLESLGVYPANAELQFSDVKATQSEAQKQCKKSGKRLFEPKNKEDIERVISRVPPGLNRKYWVGVSQDSTAKYDLVDSAFLVK